MVRRKLRTRVVLDTNVIIGALLSRSDDSANVTVVKLWMVLRYLELVVSAEVVAEYFEILPRLHIDEPLIDRFHQQITAGESVRWVNLGARVVASRDSDDDILLSTAKAGRARFLVTNDRDLLELDAAARKKLRFEIVTPQMLLARLAEK